MLYELTVLKLDEFTEEEKEKYEDHRRYKEAMPMYRDSPYPSTELYHTKRMVSVMLTEEEFQAVKKTVIGVI